MMKRFTRLALAALAAIGASGALVAAPAASWVNFGDGINNGDGTTKYYGGNAAYYITVTGGTRAADGSYIQVGTPAVEATEETEAVAATPGSVQLTVPSAVLTGKALTIVAEVQYLSAEANTLIELVVGSNAVRLKSTGTQLQQCWSDATGYGSCNWTPTNRQRVTFTYQGANYQGSHTYLGDTPTAAAMSATNLMTTTSDIGTITLGKAATGLKIYSLYVYTTKLASASAVTTEIASNKAALAVPLSFAFSRAGLTADGNTMEVLQVGGGAAKASTFTATLGTTATRVTEGSETDSTAFFKSVATGSALLTTNGYAMVQSKFASSGSKTGEGWRIYLPFTPSAETTVTRVCPQLFALNASGAVQTDSKAFGYTVTLYSGSVDESSVSSATALATAAVTTGPLNQTLVNTQAANFTDKVTLNAGTPYTMKLAVSDSSTGGGSYSGIGGVVFSSVIDRTVSGEGTWSANWPAGSAPAEDSIVELTVSDAATLSMDAAASLSSLTVLDGSADSSASLTFTGTNSLTSSATTLNVSTDVSDITASLGAVTLASGKTLTAKSAADFSSITAGSGATVKYIAPSGSIAKVDNATVELAATAATSGITLPSAGGTYKVSSGTYTGMTLAITNTQTNYDFAGGDLTFSGEFSFGRATATISGGTIHAEKMVTVQGNNEGRTSSVTQTGGDIILSGTGDGASTQNATVMFGHWPSATSTYNLSAGSITAEQGGMRFGNDSPSTLNLSGTGLLKVKGIWGKGTTNCALNLSGGTLSIGSDGFKSIDRLTVTATGGELNAFASNTIAQAITLNGPTTFSANADCEMTVQGALSGSGALTIGTETATGTVALGTQRPTIGGIADGATVKLTATEAELANRAITFSTTMGTAPAKERFTVVKPDGTAVTLTAEPTVTDGTLTVTLPQTGGVITATGNWSEAGVSGETVVYVRGGESAESAITVTLDAALSGYTQIGVIGHVKFVTTDTQSTLPTTIALESGSVLTATASFSGAYTIPSGTTVVLDGTTTAISSGNALTVNGTLKTQGTVTLSNTSNKVEATGTLTIASGTTVLSTTGSGGGIKGNLTIASGATLQCGTGDAPLYNGTQTFDISGTLEITGSTRWTISSGATITLREGARLKGAGDSSCAFDFWKGGTITADGDATIEATVGNHNSDGKTLTITQSAGTTTITGEVRNSLGLSVAGSGTVVYAPAESVTATSSPLVVDTGATLKLLPAAAFTLNGTVTGAGTLVIGDGSAATAVTLATAGNGTDVTVSPKATLTVATGAGEADANKSFTNTDNDCRTVTNNGTLKLASGYGYFKIAGTGKTVVPGSDFLFGIGGANGDGPFSNGLEVPASANFRIRPWNAPQTIVAKGTAAVDGSITKDGGNNTVTLQIAAGTTLAGSSTFSIPVAFVNDTTAKMASNATFTFSSALTVPKNVTLPGTVTLAEGATLSGAGELSGTVTLGNGVIIDATESTVSGYLKLTGETVTLGDTLKVKASKLTNVLDVPTSAGLNLEKVSLTGDSIVPAGTELVISGFSSVKTLKLFVPPAMPEDDAKLPPAIAGNDAIMAAIQEKAEEYLMLYPISEITSVTAKNSAGGAVSADGATLFTGLEVTVAVTPDTPKEDGTYKATATVTYDFGVSDITVKSAQLSGDDAARLYVVVCAKVSDGSDATAAGYANGTTVSLWLKGAAPTGVVALDADTLSAKFGITASNKGEKWFAVPVTSLEPGTNAFTVRATK